MVNESIPPVLETRRDRRIRKYREECHDWQREHDNIMAMILRNNHERIQYANTDMRIG
jgi:hypothetical protein